MASDRVDALDIFDAIATEVSIRFKPVPHGVFGLDASRFANTLRFRIWPDAATGITLAGK